MSDFETGTGTDREEARPGAPADPRLELARIAASVRAYVEWQIESGSSGVPRGERPAKRADEATPGVPGHVRASAPIDEAPPPTSSRGEAPSTPTPPPRPATASLPDPALEHTAPLAHTEPEAPASPRVEPASGSHRSLAQLRDAVASCTTCRLAETRTKTVFSRGNPEASLVFIGEAPGADEDAQGEPFVGRAGQLLDKMIGAMGLSPERDVYICNIVKCRPPANRPPAADELAACFPFLHEQLANVQPRAIVALGNTAVGALFNTKLGITRLRGEWKLYKGRIPTMPTFHPSYLLRPSPQQGDAKRQAWEDLQAVMKQLGIVAKPKPPA